ncbi:hypothetical protein diail_1907 [Diaporthe ilicicola]|nr:hypothetical protein diail_1907 [Diaporthe ilicicola]
MHKEAGVAQTRKPLRRIVARVAGYGFNDKNALWLDHFCRRHRTSVKNNLKPERFVPGKHVEPAHLAHHQEWLELCLRTAIAKTLVIFSKENETYFRQRWGGRLEKMDLWGDYKDISLWLLAPEEDTYDRVERLVLFLCHPEHIGRSKFVSLPQVTGGSDAKFAERSTELARKYDQQLGLAARLAGIVQTEEQAKYQENLVDPADIAELTEDRWDVLKRKEYNRLELVTGEAQVNVACTSCGFSRLDVYPKFLDPAVYLASRPRRFDRIDGRVYLAADATCPKCQSKSVFAPLGNVQYVIHDDFWKGHVKERKNSGPDRTSLRDLKEHEVLLLPPGESTPRWIPGSEVYTRGKKRKRSVDDDGTD